MIQGGGYARRCYEAVKERAYHLKAIEICDIAIDQEDLSRSNRAATLINRGIVFMRQENYDRAMKDYDRALALAPDMPEAKINLGATLYHLERFEEAVAALDGGVRVEDRQARAAAYYNRAISRERLGDIQRAYDDYRAALAAVPGYPPAVRQLQRYSIAPASG
jgi:tetratricopeptide (TPR) repeat protein